MRASNIGCSGKIYLPADKPQVKTAAMTRQREEPLNCGIIREFFAAAKGSNGSRTEVALWGFHIWRPHTWESKGVKQYPKFADKQLYIKFGQKGDGVSKNLRTSYMEALLCMYAERPY